MCDWVNVMYAGQVVESTPMERLFWHPQHPYSEGLLTAIPETTPRGSRLRSIPGVVPAATEWLSGCRFSPRCAHARSEVCEVGPIGLRSSEPDHFVRCARVNEIVLQGIVG